MGSNTSKHSALCCLIAAAAGLTLLTSTAAMADASSARDPVYDWSGLYAGINVGGASGAFRANTTTDPNGTFFTDPLFGLTPADGAAVNRLGAQKISTPGFTGGAEGGINWQDGSFVGGIEADLDYMHMNGASPHAAAYGNTTEFLENAYGNADWLVTVRPRVGYATGNGLFYVTGGLAIANPREDTIFTDGFGALETSSRNTVETGYTIGAGLEWGLTDQLSVKGEILHVGFGGNNGHETSGNLVPPVIDPPQVFGHRFNFSANLFRLGLNYRFGEDGALASGATPTLPELPDWLSGWRVDVGMRLWANTGRIGAPDPLLNYYFPPTIPKVLASRITFTQLGAIAAETYARFDHRSGFFIKGILGGGGIQSGHQNDEDFPAANVYSNTLSTASGALAYATVDGGYSFLTTPTANIGAFAGYNYYAEHVNTFGCVQIAMDYTCISQSKPPGLIQDGAYHSLRLGVSSQVMASDTLRLTTDAAYIPATLFDGRDDHNFRQLLLPQSATSGDGVMLDASLDYLLTDAWSVGIGGRYWAYNMRNGATKFNFLGAPPIISEPSLYNSERFGAFLQTEYRFGAVEPTKADTDTQPVDWTGIYAGGIMGAGISDAKWRDPYPSTTFFGYTNEAGFGDRVHASGPLAGGRLNGNWQFDDNIVLGAEAEASWADIRGLNTCFSGLGGVGCAHTDSAIYDLAVRGGYAWDRSLAYVKAGGAWVDAKQSIFGDTYAYLYYGTSDVTGDGHVNQTLTGLLLGVGYEFAIGDDWTGSFEYDHIGGLDSTLLLPTVTVIGASPQHTAQSLNLITVGLSYKLY